jgi:hypothetical protein
MSIVIEFAELEDSPWWQNFSKAFRRKTRKDVEEHLAEFNAIYSMPSRESWNLTFENEVGFSAFLFRWM